MRYEDMRYELFTYIAQSEDEENGIQDICLGCVATLYEALTALHNNHYLYAVDTKTGRKIIRKDKN